MATNLTFRLLAAINRQRCERWRPGFPNDGWTGADWATAMAGEAGETCNVVKKLRRDDFGKAQAAADTRPDLLAQLATEIGDTLLYLDLLAQFYGLNLADCAIDTFNRVSDREGFPERIGIPPSQQIPDGIAEVVAEQGTRVSHSDLMEAADALGRARDRELAAGEHRHGAVVNELVLAAFRVALETEDDQ